MTRPTTRGGDASDLLDAIDAKAPPPGHELLGAIDDAVVVRTGYEFFRLLAHGLAEALDTRYAFVARFDGDDYASMRIVTFHDRESGEFRDDYSFPVEGTPCVHVLEGRVIAIPSGVQQQYPAERRRGVESYLAMPIVEPGGRVAGHLVAADTRAHRWSSDDERTLRLFARRATTELLRHQYERALRDALDEARRASRARAGALAWLTHELRTPLHGILGHVELLGRMPLDGTAAESVDAIRRSAERLRMLVADSLALARAERGQDALAAQPFGVVELLEGVRRSVEPAARAEAVALAWNQRVSPECAVVGAATPLRQLLAGLLARAVTASAGGRVYFEAESSPSPTLWRLRFVVEFSGTPSLDLVRSLASQLEVTMDEHCVAPGGTRVVLSVELPVHVRNGERDAETRGPSAPPEGETISATLALALLDAARSGDVERIEALILAIEENGARTLADDLRVLARSYDMAALAERVRRLATTGDGAPDQSR